MSARDEEVEAVAQALMNWRERTADPHGDYWTSLADAAIAVLDRVRDARGDDEAARCGCNELLGGHRDECPKWGDDPPATRSPQGEDHEAGIPEAALDAAEQAVHACRRYALGHPSRKAIYVEARDEAYDVLTAALPYLSRVSAPKADENQEASQNDERRP